MDMPHHAAARLQRFIAEHPRIVVLTGAGISLASGLPTYRDREGRWLYRKPIQHSEFVNDHATRQRYWARSLAGWPLVRDARPNRAHLALAALERTKCISLLITQNVDRLHQRGGSRRVIDLHGRLDQVACLHCDQLQHRNQVQQQLLDLNGAHPALPNLRRPDGDSDLPESVLGAFTVPGCAACGGVLIPDVVFYGGHVPQERVSACFDAIDQSDALLVLGSSLQVFSGYRFCRRAAQGGKPIVIVNPGRTRADDLAALRIEEEAAAVLAAMPLSHDTSVFDTPRTLTEGPDTPRTLTEGATGHPARKRAPGAP